MTESETFLLDELYESEAAIRSDAHQEDVKRLAAMERETETLQAKIAAKVSRRALAILAWKQSTAYSEDVHAAVEAIADEAPDHVDPNPELWDKLADLEDRADAAAASLQHASSCAQHNEPAFPNGPCDCGAEDEAPEWIVAEPQAPNDASHYYSPLADEGPNPPTDFPLCTEGVEAADDELFEESVEPLRKVVGSAMDVSDEALAEARRADERDAQSGKWANGSDI